MHSCLLIFLATFQAVFYCDDGKTYGRLIGMVTCPIHLHFLDSIYLWGINEGYEFRVSKSFGVLRVQKKDTCFFSFAVYKLLLVLISYCNFFTLKQVGLFWHKLQIPVVHCILWWCHMEK